MLYTEQHTLEVKQMVVAKAYEVFGEQEFYTAYEWGQWWISFYDYHEDHERTFSVVDVEIQGVHGIDFEEC